MVQITTYRGIVKVRARRVPMLGKYWKTGAFFMISSKSANFQAKNYFQDRWLCLERLDNLKGCPGTRANRSKDAPGLWICVHKESMNSGSKKFAVCAGFSCARALPAVLARLKRTFWSFESKLIAHRVCCQEGSIAWHVSSNWTLIQF